MSFINSQSFDPLLSKTKGEKLAGSQHTCVPPYTLTKNRADMWDFSNFVRSGWSDLKDDRAVSLLQQEIPQILVLCTP